MAHHCTTKGLFGTIQANNAIDQGPLFDSKPIEQASLSAQVAYAKRMNNVASKQVDIGKYNKTGEKGFQTVKTQARELVNLGRTPEALLPEKVFSKIDKKMTQWDTQFRGFAKRLKNANEKYDKQLVKGLSKEQTQAIEAKRNKDLAPIQAEAKKAYREGIAKQFTAAKKQLEDVYNQHAEQPNKLKAELKKLGLSPEDAYYTREYLAYLENGGPYFNFNPGGGNKAIDTLSSVISNVTGKKVSFNPMTAVYNISELATKAPATFGYKNTLKGIAEAHQTARAEGVSIFEEIPSLAKKGVYNNDTQALRPEGKFDPVARTQNMLDNTAYFIGKQAGNPQKGLKEIAYRPKPWNDTFVYQSPGSKDLLSFMSFQFRHMQQYGGWWKQAVSGNAAQKKAAIGSLVTYSAMNSLIFGGKAGIPAPVYALIKACDPELDKDLKSLSKSIPVFGTVVDKGLVGTATGLELGKYAQPFGGVALGVGTDIVNTTKDKLGNQLPRVGKFAREGRADKSALIMISALASISQLHKKGLNAGAQKAIDAVTQAYINDDDYLETSLKKFFGKDAVPKKDNDD